MCWLTGKSVHEQLRVQEWPSYFNDQLKVSSFRSKLWNDNYRTMTLPFSGVREILEGELCLG